MRSSKKLVTTLRPLTCALALCGLVLGTASALFAESADERAETPAPAGWRAYLDPETGELTSAPSREQIGALSEEIRSKELPRTLSRSSAGLVPFVLEHGGRGVFLEGRFQSALVVHRRDDGSFAPVCTGDDERAGEALAEPPSPATRQWVEK